MLDLSERYLLYYTSDAADNVVVHQELVGYEDTVRDLRRVSRIEDCYAFTYSGDPVCEDGSSPVWYLSGADVRIYTRDELRAVGKLGVNVVARLGNPPHIIRHRSIGFAPFRMGIDRILTL